jgi:hypothetical protein
MPAVTGLSKIQQVGPMPLRANKHANGGIAGGEQGNRMRPAIFSTHYQVKDLERLFRPVVIRAAHG